MHILIGILLSLLILYILAMTTFGRIVSFCLLVIAGGMLWQAYQEPTKTVQLEEPASKAARCAVTPQRPADRNNEELQRGFDLYLANRGC